MYEYVHVVRIEIAKLISVGTRITYQATGDDTINTTSKYQKINGSIYQYSHHRTIPIEVFSPHDYPPCVEEKHTDEEEKNHGQEYLQRAQDQDLY